MERERCLRCCYSVLFTLLMYGLACSEEQSNKPCAPSQCGIITNISHPFRLRHDPPECGDPKFEVACENNITLLHLYNGTYRVTAINYNNYTIRVVDPGIQEGNCSSLPRYLLSRSNFTYFTFDSHDYNSEFDYINVEGQEVEQVMFQYVVYLKCKDPVRDDAAYVDTSPCVNWEGGGGGHDYAVAGDLTYDKLKSECHVKWAATIASDWESMVGGGGRIKSYSDIHRVISFGFELSWWRRACVDFKCPSDSTCSFDPENPSLKCVADDSCRGPLGIYFLDKSPMGITTRPACRYFSTLRVLAEDYLYGMQKGLLQIARKDVEPHQHDTDFILTTPAIKLGLITAKGVLYILVRFSIGIVFLSTLLIYTYRRRHMSMFENIEDFIRLHNLIPIRYSYKDLKTMTKGFSNKLGEGGFGTVYKGKLRSGYDVAIKMLGKSKANGQEIINEVATIGRIYTPF